MLSFSLTKIFLTFFNAFSFGDVRSVYQFVIHVLDAIGIHSDDGTATHSGLPIATGAGFCGKHQMDTFVRNHKVVAVIVTGQHVGDQIGALEHG